MPAVTIIGAGPAGCIAAIKLARAGWHVCLIEQHRFPRDKVCGECLSSLGLAVLGRLDLLDDLNRLGPVVLRRTILYAPDASRVELPLPEPMWGLSRLKMDAFLLEVARASGATIIQPARCESIDAGDRPATVVRDLLTNEVHRIESDEIILADGKGGLLPDRPRATSDMGIKAHFIGLHAPKDAIELFGVDGYYGGIAPIEGGQWNAALSVPAKLLREMHGDVDALFARTVGLNISMRQRFACTTRTTDWLVSPLPRFAVASTWPDHVIPIGNAAAALEPVGGEGMGLAMRSAELAAEALIDLAGRPDPSVVRASLRADFQRLWRTRSASCRGIGNLLSKPEVTWALMPLLESNPILTRASLKLVGK